MRTYFDTSALVPLLIDERSTPRCTEAWNAAELVMSSVLTYVEVHSALASAVRSGRLDGDRHRRAIDHFAVMWNSIVQIAVEDDMLHLAAMLTADQALRAYDAVHCATVLAAASDDFVAISGDRDLLRAWRALGIATIDAVP